jgi:putative chitinase
MSAILDACPPDLSTDRLAYCLATPVIETARTMQPIKEYGGAAYFRRMYDIEGERPAKARELGNLTPGDGALFAGRGYVQLTGRNNYRRATTRLRALGYLTALDDLERTPDLAMRPDVAAAILFVGMQEGWFTGRKLSDFFGPGKADAVGARRIINGQDRAPEIAADWGAMRTALVQAGHKPGAVTNAVPVPPIDVQPLPPPAALPMAPNAGRPPVPTSAPRPPASPAAPAPARGFWASLWDALTGKSAA